MIHVNFMLCDKQSSLFHGRLLSVGMYQYDQYIQYSLQLKKLNTSCAIQLLVFLYGKERATWNSNKRTLWSSSMLVGNFRKMTQFRLVSLYVAALGNNIIHKNCQVYLQFNKKREKHQAKYSSAG